MDSGDALCAFNGTGYTLDGTHVKVPESTICHDIIPPEEHEDEASSHSTTAATQILTRSALTNFPRPATEHQTAIRIEAGVTVCSNPWPACTTCAPTQETRTTPTTSTTTITNLPTDSSGRPYSVVTEIMSVGTESGQDQETSSKGVVLVEPSSPVTGPRDGGSSVGTVVAFDRLRLLEWFGFWFLVGWVRVLL